MIFIMQLLLILGAFGDEPDQWGYINKLQDKHEFYKNNEVLVKPKDAWQTLFSVHYVDADFKNLKDCVFYKVPGAEAGILKIKSLPDSSPCEDFLLSPGSREVKNIKSLQYSITDKGVQLDFTLSDFKNERWSATLPAAKSSDSPKMLTSSAEFKASKIILLAPPQNVQIPEPKELKANTLCHDINEDCHEVSRSFCSQCPQGWYEIPNGCDVGPKYCGILNCGGKGQPACRRGMKWQREELEFDCRTNSSFAYCQQGLNVACEGRKAFCR